jgi:hypothetical protein
MNRRMFLGALATAPFALSQTPDPNAIFVCPMDPDVRQHDPGTCPRCGMKLTAGLVEPVEYELDLTATPRAIRAGQPVDLTFAIHDPWKHRQVTNFAPVHEKLYHMFVVSQDLEFFLHDHPVLGADGNFHYKGLVLPKPGMYRVLSDFYPDSSAPQLTAKTLLVPGTPPAEPRFETSSRTKQTQNLRVELSTDPQRPVSAMNTQLHFKLDNRIEQYLGAWGHMLVASDDLIDLIHTHPFIADPEATGGPEIQFNVVFPRPEHHYRVWVQFQREGVVNTARFDVRASNLG